MKEVEIIKSELKQLSNPEKAAFFPRFFKTGKGQYGEGDKFIGVTVPNQRKVAKSHLDISLKELEELLRSDYHEHRLTALLILVYKFESTKDENVRSEIYDFYLENTQYVNNWDLVDTSAEMLGEYLENKDRSLLIQFANSSDLWEQRISIISTYAFIKKKDFDYTLKISEILLHHPHDLIQKAVGWMLREMGKRDIEPLIKFLDEHAHEMPRTMLRYSIEKLSADQKDYYMKAKSEFEAKL